MTLRFSAKESPATLTDDHTNEVIARIDFRHADNDLFFLDYLWTNPAHRGQGHARTIINHFADHVRTQNASIKPICGVARHMMQGDARYQDLLL